MNDTVSMFRWAVKRIKLQRLIASIPDVMARPSGHDYGYVGPNFSDIAIDEKFTFAALDAEELVAVFMHLFADLLADLLAGLKRHKYELHVLCRIKNAAKIRIPFGQALSVVNKSTRGMLLFPIHCTNIWPPACSHSSMGTAHPLRAEAFGRCQVSVQRGALLCSPPSSSGVSFESASARKWTKAQNLTIRR